MKFLKSLMGIQDTKILYVLSLITIAMIIDFSTETVAAKINKKIVFESQKGINGILRKICSMIVMIFFISVSILIPEGVEVGLVYVLYLGYLLMEVKSILKNLRKMKMDISL